MWSPCREVLDGWVLLTFDEILGYVKLDDKVRDRLCFIEDSELHAMSFYYEQNLAMGGGS